MDSPDIKSDQFACPIAANLLSRFGMMLNSETKYLSPRILDAAILGTGRIDAMTLKQYLPTLMGAICAWVLSPTTNKTTALHLMGILFLTQIHLILFWISGAKKHYRIPSTLSYPF